MAAAPVPAALHQAIVPCVAGDLAIVTHGAAVVALIFADHADRMAVDLRRRFGAMPVVAEDGSCESADRLRRYLHGDLHAMDQLQLDTGGTAFQREVWAELRRIPPGRTISYGELARRIGRPAAVRAVGAANGANPISIAIPCHRVIAADGTLHGYGGGLPRKRWLLRHEGYEGASLSLSLPLERDA